MCKEENYIRQDKARNLVSIYVRDLAAREPPLKSSRAKEYIEWSSIKTAAESILERIIEGFDPIVTVEDYIVQYDYFSQKASESGNYDTSDMFAIWSDVACDILALFHDADIHYEEDIYNE